MESVISQKEKIKTELERLLIEGKNYIIESSDNELACKSTPTKWSKKEIPGHLIDSVIHTCNDSLKFSIRASLSWSSHIIKMSW